MTPSADGTYVTDEMGWAFSPEDPPEEIQLREFLIYTRFMDAAYGDAMGANATLVVTSSTGQTSPPSTGTGSLTVGNWCVDAGGPQKKVTFTATLTTGATTPARTSPAPQLADATTPLDPPTDFSSGAVKLAADGTSGTLKASVNYGNCNAGGGVCTLKFSWSGASGPASDTATASGGTWTYTLPGLTNGNSVTVSAQLCNARTCNAAQSASATPYGPLSAPTVTASASGTQTCGTVTSMSGNGLATTGRLWDDHGNSWTFNVPAGTSSVAQKCVDIGYSADNKFHATLDGNGGRSNSGQGNSGPVTTENAPSPSCTAQWNGAVVDFSWSNLPDKTYVYYDAGSGQKCTYNLSGGSSDCATYSGTNHNSIGDWSSTGMTVTFYLKTTMSATANSIASCHT